ncbi:cytochrome P450 2K1-like isoform X1 [Protopterus annectens]|uniref:cytochrome P450 2K1-like isoform X1 n=1 Tax=Protopterus annectens TaxID=7888 RepID=UPI001CFBBDE6|nr:cytochrome P450 2K1-like isoform X1 [Protopterus annectens]
MVLLIFIFLFILFYYFYSKLQITKSFKFPPGPVPLPVIGNLHLLDFRKPYATLIQLSEKYGPVYTFHMGMTKTVVLIGYDAVKDALVNYADEFGERGRVPAFDRFAQGNGVSFGHGESWRQMRRFTIATLKDFGMGRSKLDEMMLEESTYLIEVFKSHKGQPFDNSSALNAAISNNISSIVFGKRFDYKDETFILLLKKLSDFFRVVGHRMTQLYNIYPILEYFPGAHREIFSCKENLYAYIKQIHKESKSKLQYNDLRNFIDAFVVKQSQERDTTGINYFHDKNLVETTATLFVAGTETATRTLRWSLLLMAKYPEIQKKVQNEIDKVVGSERFPSTKDRKNLPYCNAVIHEVQRFSNVVPLSLQHETAADVHFRGYFLPKGTQVIACIGSALYDKTQWATPDKFNPSHFLDTKGNFVLPDAFLPFSAGRRICLGEAMAKAEIFIFFVVLLQKFAFVPPPGITAKDLDIESAPGTSSKPKPHKLCAVLR